MDSIAALMRCRSRPDRRPRPGRPRQEETMLNDAMFETRDPIAVLAGRLPFEPVEVDDAVFAETRWRQPKPGAVIGGSEVPLSRWTASGGKERPECATTPDPCHFVAFAVRA